MTKTNLFLLKFGTLQTILMGVYHFYLPFQYNWGNYLEQKKPTINWSLFSLNNYFSFNLLVIALFLGYYLYRKIDKIEVIKTLSAILLLFWVFSSIYQLIKPMPLPEHLSWIGSILLGVAFLNGLIFLIPLISLMKKT
jgi:hypothetical protein